MFQTAIELILSRTPFINYLDALSERCCDQCLVLPALPIAGSDTSLAQESNTTQTLAVPTLIAMEPQNMWWDPILEAGGCDAGLRVLCAPQEQGDPRSS